MAAPNSQPGAPAATGIPTGEPTPRSWIRSIAVVFVVALALAAAGSAVHVVAPGETLAVIAAKHDTNVSALVEANNIANPNLILVGQQLTIPGTTATTVHTVTPGESLSVIAARYGTTVSALVDANGLRNPHLIKIGQELVIPNAGTSGEDAPLYHRVQRGESLASIAARHGLTVGELAAYNGMTQSSVIYEGTQLRLSPLPTYDAPAGSTTTHVVVRGETLGGIAARYGTTVSRLVDLNGIADPSLIFVGQRLVVAGGGFQCPVPGATFFNDWGFPRPGGRLHKGNDLFAAGGAPVLAPVNGVVEQISGTIGGLQFWLEGDDGNLYIGTHMSSSGATGRVTAGTQVGTVGDSGNARGSRPHLHFEILIGGHTNINPYPALVAACT